MGGGYPPCMLSNFLADISHCWTTVNTLHQYMTIRRKKSGFILPILRWNLPTWAMAIIGIENATKGLNSVHVKQHLYMIFYSWTLLWLQNSPCNACCVHCCLHWCALCQEHREMKGRLSDNVFSEMTIVNPPPIQEMKSNDEKENPETSSADNNEHITLEMQAI